MADGFFSKQTSESFYITCSFANNLIENETITSINVKAYLNDVEITNDVIGTTLIIENVPHIKVKDGIPGRKYKITCIAITNNGNIYESDVEMKVVNI